jgi:hypothetical protein
MKSALTGVLVTVSLVASAAAAHAEPFLRYALIVGENQGRTETENKLDPLKHAEGEAAALRDALVRLGGFPASSERVVLLQGKGRAEILAAAVRLAGQHRMDRNRFGNVRTMFAFFFTGHGLEGKLLTADDPLTGIDIGHIFKEVDATFSLGLFDACFSGSLDFALLRAKGLRPPRGFDAFGQLPQEMLNAEGSMWLVSSLPSQLSYEDERVGSVFTHFFIEGLRQARADDFGVSLESVWEYASRHTQQHTAAAGRPQTPQKLVRELTATGPIYMGYGRPRSAQITFSSDLGGQFLMRYETGELSEILHKEPGKALSVSVFPGALWIEAENLGTPRRQRLELAAGENVQLHDAAGWRPQARLGKQEIRIVAKGEEIPGIYATREVPRLSTLVDFGYQMTLRPQNASVPMHAGALAVVLEWGRLSLRLGGDIGWSSRQFATWSSSTKHYAGEIGVGLAGDIGPLHVVSSLYGRFARTVVSYDSDKEQQRNILGAGASMTGLLPLFRQPTPLYLSVRVGLLAEPVASLAFGSETEWTVMPFVGVGLAGRAW